ncbi:MULTISPECIES: hypothetical protein [Chryseobacterium]|uniref:Uncharacterized protein n=2 Tax=Chryseobacterium gleum TaxID=250 RepID=A0A3S4NYB9_CHRGE|nr:MULTISPECIES: hypothetical protein [Chryseobacterium]HAF35329.1 hypothetical protein [Sphingobacterium sp.]EFK36052.1 hypothetical protein HMPREF0204_15121 [Chryseobacterium gleum ATCC 35910]QQY31754.1 hypothetical protein I6I60_23395 [Chryseobacterium gleum]VEE11225.1 Uncharacterised protein [Chryseobacterium gleum]VFA44022.1 Uncharacterised protein [Chryseobacterium indologenes]
MKTLHHMNNLDRAYLLARLFPEELKPLTEFIKKEAELWHNHRTEIEENWTEKDIDVSIWFDYIANFEHRCLKNGTRLYRNKKTFRDQLFDGYDALFSMHATIHYTEQKECSRDFKYAIYMLFGDRKIVDINLNP